MSKINAFSNGSVKLGSGAASPTNRASEWTLARMLEIANKPESAEGKHLAEKLADTEKIVLQNQVLSGSMPRALADMMVDEYTERRDLLLTESIESTTLVQTEFYRTVLEGSEPNKIIRSAIPVINVARNTTSFVLGETGSVLGKVAEGAELPNNQQNYSKVDLTTEKYGEKNIISNELIEDSLFEVVAMEVAKSGARAENTLNHVGLTALLDDAGKEHDTAGSNQGVKALLGARKEMRSSFFDPDTAIICSDAEYQLGIDTQISYASYAGNNTLLSTGRLPSILGLNIETYDAADTTYNSGTYTWDYDTDGEIGMVLVDTSRLSALIGIRRDITVEKYSDPIRDLKGAALTFRFGVETPFDNGICRVEF
jgi:HK97 family phage major capsid protein